MSTILRKLCSTSALDEFVSLLKPCGGTVACISPFNACHMIGTIRGIVRHLFAEVGKARESHSIPGTFRVVERISFVYVLARRQDNSSIVKGRVHILGALDERR